MSPIATQEMPEIGKHSRAMVMHVCEDITSYQQKFPVQHEHARYILDSELYTMRGGFVAEVISNPFIKLMEKGITEKVVKDLQEITLRSFEKTIFEAETFASDKVIFKNCILVDWLTVVRRGARIVAYTSGSYIERDSFYIHATIVDPIFQNSGLGVVPNIFLWDKLSKSPNRSKKLNLICRTRNRSVASLLTHIWENMTISGEENIRNEFEALFVKTAEMTHCEFNEKGIAKNVYPAGLPNGSNKHSNFLNIMFDQLGQQDAFFIAGTANLGKLNKILKREIVKKNGSEKQVCAPKQQDLVAIAS